MKIQGQNKEMAVEVAQIALETLEGHQRAIIAHLTVEVGRLDTHYFQLAWTPDYSFYHVNKMDCPLVNPNSWRLPTWG